MGIFGILGNGAGGIDKAMQVDYVLAVNGGNVVGVFKPKEWQRTTNAECNAEQERCKKLLSKDCKKGRIRFDGVEADSIAQKKYLGRSVPSQFNEGFPFQYTF